MRKVAVFIYILIVCARWESAESIREYSYADCTYVKGDSAQTYSGSRCFCYSPGTVIKWKDIWSTFKVNVTSDEDVFILFPMETRNCHHPDDLLTVTNCFVEHYWPSTVQSEKVLDVPLVDEDVCFMTKSPRSNTEYTLHVSNKKLNRMRFLLFIIGLVLFLRAGIICRSSLFFYITGVSLGVVGTFVFLTLIFRNVVPKLISAAIISAKEIKGGGVFLPRYFQYRGLFLVLLGAGSSLSYIGVRRVLSVWDDIVTQHWMELLVYVLILGLFSFAVCYSYGPITNKHTLNFMTCSLQLVGIVLLYYGITFPPAYYILLAFLLCWKILPLAWGLLVGVCSLFCYFPGLFWRKKQSRVRLLTEDEYREQGERHTKACLDELREHCNKPSFSAWETVLRLRAPKKFAEFLRSGRHVTTEELQSHESHYGFGGAYHEELLFNNCPGDGQLQKADEEHSEDDSPTTSNNLTGPSLCPYPPLNYTPQPQPIAAEDEDYF